MTRFNIVGIALLLTTSGAAMAQDADEQSQSDTSAGVERVEGVPDNFTLQPGPEAVRNRMEPMVQPLPTPSASPTANATPAPQVTPSATPTPQITALPEPEPRPTATPQTRTSAAAIEEAPRANIQQPDPSDVPIPEEATEQVPQSSAAPTVIEEVAAEEHEASGFGLLAWLLGGVLLLAAAILGVWWWRNRAGTAFVVERIEPYRPPPSPPREIEPPAKEIHTPPPAKPQSSGFVHASRPAPASNPGGFVTSTINARQRGNTTPDGRVVTSLSRGPHSRS